MRVDGEEGLFPPFLFTLCLAGCLWKELSRMLIHDESITVNVLAEMIQIRRTKMVSAESLGLAISFLATG